MSDAQIERVLGMFWKPNEDIITFSLNFLKAHESILQGKKIPTKREVLALVMSLYDPLGLLSLFTVKAKLIIQRAWKNDIGWDDPIPISARDHWNMWLEELKNIPNFKIPRCYSPDFTTAQVQLHVFCDAGEEAYGAVAYLRIGEEEVTTSLVMAKSKVAPLKILSIPRLELQAAVIGCRIAKFIREELEVPITRTIYWSDSSTVLHWIRAEGRRYQQFVGHRVGEIHELTTINEWRWIPTEENVADEMTRISKRSDWGPDSRWINGPPFLDLNEKYWPQEKEQTEPDEAVLELRKNQMLLMEEQPAPIDVARFSNWRKLVRTTAYVLKFIRMTRKEEPKGVGLSLEDISKAEQWWWWKVQEDSFPKEKESIQSNQPLPKSSRLNKTELFLDSKGIIRVRGRLTHADVPVDIKQPVVMDAKHPYVRLLILHFHKVCGHHGHERIGNEIRQQLFIPSLRQAVRSASNRCQLCRLRRSQPQPPQMGQLPKFRVEGGVHPFNQTGLDYFGPIEVIVKRSREKRYGALFTCLSTRAIHLEIAGSLSTDSCIMAIRRFVSRRGCPAVIHSDNGTNFHGAANELKKAIEELDQSKIEEECQAKSIKWTFLAPSSPHMAGAWERMVRSVKIALGDVLKQKTLQEEVLHTVLVEAEHTVNSHPLTHVPDDPSDPDALTPNHFLLGRTSNLQPIGQFSQDDLIGRRHWRMVQHLANHFWRRWVREYLPTLLRREKWHQVTRPVQVGDVVLEVNSNLPRNTWPKGRIVKIFPGDDGITRVVDIRLANGHIYRRPVAKLCVLDLEDSTRDEDKKSV